MEIHIAPQLNSFRSKSWMEERARVLYGVKVAKKKKEVIWGMPIMKIPLLSQLSSRMRKNSLRSRLQTAPSGMAQS